MVAGINECRRDRSLGIWRGASLWLVPRDRGSGRHRSCERDRLFSPVPGIGVDRDPPNNALNPTTAAELKRYDCG
jgi:hypothetical protein